ncbi:MAG: HAD family hydrolase [Desulfobacterales bacterium]|jgi:D-glycero-D-manno-heptose 1,7-bisphosphate phosphatase|nr:HAD family hydrolase [Desulfobacterales bacterium]
MRRNVVFTDRDGVINRNSPDYIKRPEAFDFLPGSRAALCRLAENGFDIIVVTNQSALGRGFMTIGTLDEIHRRMVAAVESDGGRILDILVCPHLPGDGCGCRKPAPGLLLDAQRKHRIDFSAAVMIGDSATDIECALSAGVRTAVLVRTGNGAEAERELAACGVLPDVIADDLNRAVEWIITTIR